MSKLSKITLVVLLGIGLVLLGTTAKAADGDEFSTTSWRITSAGTLRPVTDSAEDIGASGAEVSSIYCDTLVVGGDSVTGASQISTPMEDPPTS